MHECGWSALYTQDSKVNFLFDSQKAHQPMGFPPLYPLKMISYVLAILIILSAPQLFLRSAEQSFNNRAIYNPSRKTYGILKSGCAVESKGNHKPQNCPTKQRFGSSC